MPDLLPYALLALAIDTEAFGEVTYRGDSVTWPLSESIGRPGAVYSGFVTDPSGLYQMQAPVNVWVDSDETQWGSITGTFSHGTDPSSGKKFLVNTLPTAAYSATSTLTRAAEEGISLQLFLAAHLPAASRLRRISRSRPRCVSASSPVNAFGSSLMPLPPGAILRWRGTSASVKPGCSA